MNHDSLNSVYVFLKSHAKLQRHYVTKHRPTNILTRMKTDSIYRFNLEIRQQQKSNEYYGLITRGMELI